MPMLVCSAAMAVARLGVLVWISLLVSTSSAQESPTNVAVNKTATQSSTFDGTDTFENPTLTFRASADLAVDGASTKSYLDKTCAVTDWLNPGKCTNNPWWQVDLGGLYDVFNVTIHQRGEREPGKPNYGPLVVRVGDHEVRPENRIRYSDRPLVSVPLSPPVRASTVNISIPRCAILQLCEVEVFAVRHVNECASSPCEHGGHCTYAVNSYTCACVPGYSGVHCQTDINECGSSPCQHGATCRDLVNKFVCDCPPGYTGTTCETDVDECSSNPCQHGGTCTDGVNSYTCTCATGYTDDNCQRDIDECASSPCENGGTCQDNPGFYSCACSAGFTGLQCQQDVDECASSPCSNNSTCMNGVNSYTCQCANGYSGPTCSKPCSRGRFGPGCSGTCSPYCLESSDKGGQHCDHVTGQCVLQTGCKDGYQGSLCATEPQRGIHETVSSVPLISGVVGAVVVLVVVVVVVVWYRRKQPSEKQKSHPRDLEAMEVPHADEEEPPEENQEKEEDDMAGKSEGVYYNTSTALAPTRIARVQLPDIVAASRANEDHFKEEYVRLPQGLQHPHKVGLNKHNKGKNRYKNICAYDHSRVVLATLPGDPHSDYINACYVDGYKKPQAFIASQGPTKVNETDFIRMIWEKDIETIAMVTNHTEMGVVKCVQYWSDTGEKKIGKFRVKADNVREKRDLTIQRLTIQPSDGAAKQVTHFLYKAWPDKDVPYSPWSLLDFRDKVMTSHTGRSPLLVHCSAGIGRTGTLVALDTALRQLEEEGVVDFFTIVLQMRQQRMGLVQTQDQYTFLHEAALVGLCCADRVVPLETFPSDPVAKDKAKIAAEFEALERCRPSFSSEELSLARSGEAVYANRDPDILPPNNNIVWLKKEVEGSSSYLNAVFIPSYTEERRYILTQTPLPSTVLNFWRAVLEYNVKAVVTLDRIQPDLQAGVGDYVPAGQTPLDLGPLSLTLVQTQRKQGYTLHTLDVTMDEEAPRRIQQYVVNTWPESACVPSDPGLTVSLAEDVLRCTPPKQGVILLHCRDGARRSGLLCALLALLERCRSDREVAVPHLLGVLKSIRPQAVPTQEQYAFLYAAMLSHVDSSQVYQNVPRPQSRPGGTAPADSVYSN